MQHLAVAGEPAALLARLRTVRPDDTRQWGTLTAPEMVTHLADSFRGVLGDRSLDSVSSLAGRTVMRWFALYLPVPWPKNVKTMRQADPRRDGTRPDVFAADVEALEALVHRFADAADRDALAPHPIFGRMGKWEWLRWGWLHMDHHLRQFGR